MKPLIAFIAISAFAQQASGPAAIPLGPGATAEMGKDASKVPVIPIELQAEYFRTDGILAHMRAEMDKANTDYEAAVKAMLAACGKGFSPTMTPDKKNLVCAAQPAK
jgi:hypothetical protein